MQDNPPLLNWIYINKDTMQLNYGNRSASIEHNIGPWDWSEDEMQVVYDDIEVTIINAFHAVECSPGKWQLFFDMDGNRLQDHVPTNLRRVRVELHRTMIEPEGRQADVEKQ